MFDVMWIVALWLACSILVYGITLGYFATEYPLVHLENPRSNYWFAATLALWGPISLVPVIFLSRGIKHGLRWS